MSIYVKVRETSLILQTCAVCDLSARPPRQEGAMNTAELEQTQAVPGAKRTCTTEPEWGNVRSCNRKDAELLLQRWKMQALWACMWQESQPSSMLPWKDGERSRSPEEPLATLTPHYYTMLYCYIQYVLHYYIWYIIVYCVVLYYCTYFVTYHIYYCYYCFIIFLLETMALLEYSVKD